ncbi:MAG: hypothetical protein HQL47_10190, partial [Gammaproteobacteria bacterium]|nr:hypothetical protein [Gammaproteobacteria bacterium]
MLICPSAPPGLTSAGLLLLALLGLPAGPLGAADLSQQRDDFLAAEAALRKGDSASYIPLRAKLQNYPLFPYLEYAEAQPGKNEQVDAFLAKYTKTPLDYDLRRRQLKLLAEKKDWKTFLSYWQETSNTEMQCLRLQGLIATGQAELAQKQGAKIWLHGDALPDSCDPVFEHMQKAGKLSRQLVWDRIDLFREGDADNRTAMMKYLRRFLPATDNPWHDLWMLSLTQ